MKSMLSPYPPAETLWRIAKSFDATYSQAPMFTSSLFKPKGRVLGRLDGDRFRMYINGNTKFSPLPPMYLRPKPEFVGRVMPSGSGSVVEGGLDWNPIRIFAVLWFVFLLVFIPVGLRVAAADPSDIIFGVVPLAMIPMGALAFWVISRAMEADAREIRSIIAAALQPDALIQ